MSKLNAFDLVVTVALGSTLSSILVNKSVALAEGIAALGWLIGLQYAAAWTALRWPLFAGAIKSAPTLLLRHGSYIDTALRSHRISRSEAQAAIRGAGLSDESQVAALILEGDGTISVIRESAPAI